MQSILCSILHNISSHQAAQFFPKKQILYVIVSELVMEIGLVEMGGKTGIGIRSYILSFAIPE